MKRWVKVITEKPKEQFFECADQTGCFAPQRNAERADAWAPNAPATLEHRSIPATSKEHHAKKGVEQSDCSEKEH